MKRFIFSILFILIGVFVVDRAGGKVMWWINRHTQDVSGPKIKYLVNDVHEDVVMMGASRCNLHYVPSIISDSIGMSVYNGGVDASNNIYAHYIVLNHILAHHTPKVICLEIMTSDYGEESNPFNTVTFFAPYIGINERADSVFREAGLYRRYMISHLYRYNAKAVSNLLGLFVNRNAAGENGYVPSYEPEHFPTQYEYWEKPEKIDSTKIEYLQKYIDLCIGNNIKLIFVVSPAYAQISDDVYDVAKEIAASNNIPFLDFHSKGLYMDRPDYFKDNAHLRDKGARNYSALFASDLRKLLQQK